MGKYRCCLKCDYDDGYDAESIEVKGFEPSDAAERYADEIFHSRDMWEIRGDWEGDYSVIVEDIMGNISNFNITVEQVPSFHATLVKGVDK